MNLGTAYFRAQTVRKGDRDVPDRYEARSGRFRAPRQCRRDARRAQRAGARQVSLLSGQAYAKGGRNDLALQYLRKCLEEGFKEKKKLEEEADFATLRELPEFKELMAKEQRVL